MQRLYTELPKESDCSIKLGTRRSKYPSYSHSWNVQSSKHDKRIVTDPLWTVVLMDLSHNVYFYRFSYSAAVGVQ